jgi:hypothetical protein
MFEAQIERGIAVLDQHGPKDWRDRINVDKLNMLNGDYCVLGQLFPDARETGYDVGASYLYTQSQPYGWMRILLISNSSPGTNPVDRWAAQHGFFIDSLHHIMETYATLTREWQERLRRDRESQLATQVDDAMTYELV